MFWKIKNNKNASETAKEISSVYGQGIITGRLVQNWFSKFCSVNMSLRNESRPGHSLALNQDA